MKKRLKHVVGTMMAAGAIVFGLLSAGVNTAQAQKIQYGGTFTFTDMYPQINPMSWDSVDWNWRHGYDTGYYIEHLLMGDLQKGPRGTKQYKFQNSGCYIPPGAVRGELAERWEVKQNPLSIVFYLRKGVMWQDKPGVMKAREFVADDVVYAINRLKTSRKAIPAFLDFIDRMEAKDKHTVIAHLKEWNSDWGYYLGWGYYDAIQAPEQEKAEGGPGRWQNAAGTGPFMIEEYKPAHSMTYKRNPNYWDSDIINKQKYQLPFVDRVVSMLMKDESTILTALRTGKLDMMTQMGWRQMQEMKKTTPELIWTKNLTINASMIALRMDKKPFTHVRVRRALNMAIDRKALATTFAGGEVQYVNVPFPYTSTSVYTPLEQLPPAAKELFVYDPEKAKKLLAEAGYPNGFSFKCQYGGSGSEAIDYLSMIAAMLAKVGVTMELNVMDYSSGLSRMTRKLHDEAMMYTTDHATPLAIIRRAFMTGQTWNASMMDDERVNSTWKRLTTDTKLTQKQVDAELKALGVYIMEQAPGILLSGGYGYSARWPWVKNYYGELRVGAHRMGPIIARIWIDQELKKKMGY
ncbi:MAG: ABC transporter substrate-binding protein [Deltaproteobacteria bacterium]|nr:ABC transporter substrate-binding protein [Deltaproteobacteria bacterium]